MEPFTCEKVAGPTLRKRVDDRETEFYTVGCAEVLRGAGKGIRCF
jgi:hypothetical protein